MPDTKLDNLNRWTESDQPGKWVGAHSGQWTYSEWMALLDELKSGSFWPMSPDDIGAHLESLAKDYRQKRERILNSGKKIALASPFWSYVAGLSIVGLASGFFAGASHTELHHLLSLSRQLCPPRAGCRVLFKSPRFVPFKLKIHFPQSGSAGLADGKVFVCQSNNFRVFHHRLTPHRNEGFF